MKFRVLKRSATRNAEITSGSIDSKHFFKLISQSRVRPVCELRQTRTHSAHQPENALRWRASESLQLIDFIGADERT